MNVGQFKQLLTHLGFTGKGGALTKYFGGDTKFSLAVDYDKQELIYPEDSGFIVNERQTCNFKSAENFVVFECVHRLFEKGYQPKHIELERPWKLGHTGKSGRADIWIKNNQGKSLLIIECKTTGREFEGAWKDMQEDGAQLFSYFQQERDTRFLALYTSDFDGGKINFGECFKWNYGINGTHPHDCAHRPSLYVDNFCCAQVGKQGG